jgi:hypothetical protein
MRFLVALLGQVACYRTGYEHDFVHTVVHAGSQLITEIDHLIHRNQGKLRRAVVDSDGRYNDPAYLMGIAHGDLVPQNEVPAWMGGLYVAEGSGDECGAVCGGALISPGVFLVAAHCIFGELTEDGELHTLENRLDTLRVALQQAYVPTPDECESGRAKPIPSERVYKIRSAHRHCDWSNNPDISDSVLYKDIAVLYLDRCADVRTPLIAGRGFDDHAGMETVVYGWGEDEKHVESSYLKVGNMTVASVGTTDQDCGHQRGKTHPGVMCVDLKNNKAPGARSGDSGGPVMVDNTHVGIVSGGDEKNA